MSLVLLFRYLILKVFWMLVHPSSGTCVLFVELFHGLYCSGSMCVGVTVWFGSGGVVSGCRLKHPDTTPPQPTHTVTPTHIVPEQYNPWNNSTNKTQSPEIGWTVIPRLTSDPDNEFFRLTNVLVDARANIKQQTWTVDQAIPREKFNQLWAHFWLPL
jgi:hypothetical protein